MIKKALLISALLLPTALASTNIEIIVSLGDTAEFNFLVESEDGSEPIIGQYACGSYWVAPNAGDPGGVKLISLLDESGVTTDLTLDDDPVPYAHGLLDNTKTYGSHSVAAEEMDDLPKVYTAPASSVISLVAAKQNENGAGGTSAIVGESADAYAILTIVDAVPASNGANSIRPNIVGDTKELLDWTDFDLTRIDLVDYISSATIATVQERWRHAIEIFSMKGWNGSEYKSYSEGGRAYRPHLLHHDYGAGRAATLNNEILAMFSDAQTTEAKKPALAALIAHGLDIWHFMYGRSGYPGAWSSGATQWSGQIAAPLFAAALLDDGGTKVDKFKNISALTHGNDADQRGPLEMRQILRGVTGVLLWGDGHEPTATAGLSTPQDPYRRYWNDLKWGMCWDAATPGSCNAGVGKKTSADPHRYIDGPPATPGSGYLSSSLGNQRSLAAIALIFPEFRAGLNDDRIIEYADRHERYGLWTALDPVAPPQTSDEDGCNIWSAPFTGIGCDGYQTNWGPSAADLRFAIEDGTGRYPSDDGNLVTPNYGSSRSESNWNSFMLLYDGPTYEDYALADYTTVVAPDVFIYPDGGSTYVEAYTGTFDADIYYTTDGSTPDSGDTLYSSAFTVTGSYDVRMIAVKSGLTDSHIVQRTPSGVTITPSSEGGPPVGNSRRQGGPKIGIGGVFE